jgi:hypothetical protein
MRGEDASSASMFNYIDLEKRVWADHPLRANREVAEAAMAAEAIPETDIAVARDIIGRFTNVCYDPTGAIDRSKSTGPHPCHKLGSPGDANLIRVLCLYRRRW